MAIEEQTQNMEESSEIGTNPPSQAIAPNSENLQEGNMQGPLMAVESQGEKRKRTNEGKDMEIDSAQIEASASFPNDGSNPVPDTVHLNSGGVQDGTVFAPPSQPVTHSKENEQNEVSNSLLENENLLEGNLQGPLVAVEGQGEKMKRTNEGKDMEIDSAQIEASASFPNDGSNPDTAKVEAPLMSMVAEGHNKKTKKKKRKRENSGGVQDGTIFAPPSQPVTHSKENEQNEVSNSLLENKNLLEGNLQVGGQGEKRKRTNEGKDMEVDSAQIEACASFPNDGSNLVPDAAKVEAPLMSMVAEGHSKKPKKKKRKKKNSGGVQDGTVFAPSQPVTHSKENEQNEVSNSLLENANMLEGNLQVEGQGEKMKRTNEGKDMEIDTAHIEACASFPIDGSNLVPDTAKVETPLMSMVAEGHSKKPKKKKMKTKNSGGVQDGTVFAPPSQPVTHSKENEQNEVSNSLLENANLLEGNLQVEGQGEKMKRTNEGKDMENDSAQIEACASFPNDGSNLVPDTAKVEAPLMSMVAEGHSKKPKKKKRKKKNSGGVQDGTVFAPLSQPVTHSKENEQNEVLNSLLENANLLEGNLQGPLVAVEGQGEKMKRTNEGKDMEIDSAQIEASASFPIDGSNPVPDTAKVEAPLMSMVAEGHSKKPKKKKGKGNNTGGVQDGTVFAPPSQPVTHSKENEQNEVSNSLLDKAKVEAPLVVVEVLSKKRKRGRKGKNSNGARDEAVVSPLQPNAQDKEHKQDEVSNSLLDKDKVEAPLLMAEGQHKKHKKKKGKGKSANGAQSETISLPSSQISDQNKESNQNEGSKSSAPNLDKGENVATSTEGEGQKKKQKKKKGQKSNNETQNGAVTSPSQSKLSSFLEKMKARLTAGHFRMLNEKLYTCSGNEALEYFKENPSLFNLYHTGYQEQMSHWPKQPVNVIIKWLKSRSPTLIVADFGCGDARLAKSVENKVYSFDLVASDPSVIACDMSRTCLRDGSVDVAVFCLSLMGTDYPKYLREACRVLKQNGFLLIAEVKSRLDPDNGGADPQKFSKAICDLGFTPLHQDFENKMFVMFHFKRNPKVEAVEAEIEWPELKPCMYKRR